MRKIKTVSLVALLMAVPMESSFADSIENGSIVTIQSPKAEAREEVEKAIEHFRQAMLQRRPDWILADSATDLTFGHSNGVVQTAKEFAEVVRSGEEVFKRIDITDRHLTISGNVAIERHHFSADIIYKGELKTFELEVVEVWQKTDTWHLLARQAIKS